MAAWYSHSCFSFLPCWIGLICVAHTIWQILGVECGFLGQVRKDIETFTLSVLGHSLGLWRSVLCSLLACCCPRHFVFVGFTPEITLLPDTQWPALSPLSRFGSRLPFSERPSLITVFKIKSLSLTWQFPLPPLPCLFHNPYHQLYFIDSSSLSLAPQGYGFLWVCSLHP